MTVHAELLHLLDKQRAEFRGRAGRRPFGLPSGVKKVRDLDAWDRGGILEGEEEAGAGTLIRGSASMSSPSSSTLPLTSY